jgi:hypothetical protein
MSTPAEVAELSSSRHHDVIQGETAYEKYFDLVTGFAFLITATVAVKRISRRARASSTSSSASGSSGAEATVVTAFYSLILATSVLRAIWFLVPLSLWQQPSYTPTAVFAWEKPSRQWIGASLSELVVTTGSLTLFSIFILILVYWADILKKYFHPGARRSLPMTTFLCLVGSFAVLEVLNCALFLFRLYSTEGMILFDAVLLALVSMVCVCEITIFSHRFRTVLQTLGAINQVSTDAQVRRIVWITVTGNLFFLTRAILETIFAGMLVYYWQAHGTVQKVFSHALWDSYTAIKYWSEIMILSLMLYILQSRFTTHAAAVSTAPAANGTGQGGSYQKVPTGEP